MKRFGPHFLTNKWSLHQNSAPLPKMCLSFIFVSSTGNSALFVPKPRPSRFPLSSVKLFSPPSGAVQRPFIRSLISPLLPPYSLPLSISLLLQASLDHALPSHNFRYSRSIIIAVLQPLNRFLSAPFPLYPLPPFIPPSPTFSFTPFHLPSSPSPLSR